MPDPTLAVGFIARHIVFEGSNMAPPQISGDQRSAVKKIAEVAESLVRLDDKELPAKSSKVKIRFWDDSVPGMSEALAAIRQRCADLLA